MGQSCKDPCRSTSVGTHASSYNSDKRKICLQFHIIRIYDPVDPGDHLLLLLGKLILMDIDRHSIDPGRDMFKSDPLLFQHLKDFSAKSDLGIHHGFFNI